MRQLENKYIDSLIDSRAYINGFDRNLFVSCTYKRLELDQLRDYKISLLFGSDNSLALNCLDILEENSDIIAATCFRPVVRFMYFVKDTSMSKQAVALYGNQDKLTDLNVSMDSFSFSLESFKKLIDNCRIENKSLFVYTLYESDGIIHFRYYISSTQFSKIDDRLRGSDIRKQL
jgi:hypothetical protein